VRSTSDVRDIEIIVHTYESLVPDSRVFLEVEIAIANLKIIKRQVMIKFRQNR
jgi:hypothetical protein